VTETPFSGIRLLTRPGEVMTPRPATAALVETAAALVGDRRARVADVGTGSGAVAVAVAIAAPNARVWATDISSAAVLLARANVARHGLGDRVAVSRADLLDGVPDGLDLVVANLPYLPDHLRGARPELAGEPPQAVFARGDGLGHYRRLLSTSRTALRPDGAVVLQLHRRVLLIRASELEAERSGSLINRADANGIGSFEPMAKPPALQDVICVHCGKPFRAEVLAPESEQAGVKCPHCKLFMPLERIEASEDAA